MTPSDKKSSPKLRRLRGVSGNYSSLASPSTSYNVRFAIEGHKPMTLDLLLEGKRRSKHGAITVHGFSVKLAHQTIISWSSAHLPRLKSKLA